MCLISDLSLFSNSETFQLSFEFHIQIGAEFHLSLHIVALLRGRPSCRVERDVAWDEWAATAWRMNRSSPYSFCWDGELHLLRPLKYHVWADWETGPVLFPALPNMTGKNAPWIATNHLTHSNSGSEWFYEPYKKMNVVRLKVFLLWSSSWKLVCCTR